MKILLILAAMLGAAYYLTQGNPALWLEKQLADAPELHWSPQVQSAEWEGDTLVVTAAQDPAHWFVLRLHKQRLQDLLEGSGQVAYSYQAADRALQRLELHAEKIYAIESINHSTETHVSVREQGDTVFFAITARLVDSATTGNNQTPQYIDAELLDFALPRSEIGRLAGE